MLRPNANQNIIDVDGSYFRIRDIEFEGGSKGVCSNSILKISSHKTQKYKKVRLENNVSNAEFMNLKIHGTADGGFTANTNGYDFGYITVSNVEIYNTSGYGECFYLGCNSDACQFHDSIIEYSYCHDTFSDYGNGQGDGIDLKSGSYSNTISNNIIVNTMGPGIVTYDSYDRGNNIIINNIILNAGNVFFHFVFFCVQMSTKILLCDICFKGNEAIQVVAGTEVYNNILHSSCCHALVANSNQLKDQTSPREVSIIGNTIVAQNPSSLTQVCPCSLSLLCLCLVNCE